MASRLPCLLALTALLLGAPARAEAPEAFARLRDRAQVVESLSSFLERYMGTCPDLLERPACRANAEKARAQMTGKLFYALLDDGASRLIRAGTFNPRNREYRLELTPFFDAGGLALTEGAPLGQDAQGRPRIPLIPLSSTLPDDWMPMDMERVLRTGQVRIHLVFKPVGTWSLPGKMGQKMEGVKAKLLAVRLTNARSGAEIALRLAPEK